MPCCLVASSPDPSLCSLKWEMAVSHTDWGLDTPASQPQDATCHGLAIRSCPLPLLGLSGAVGPFPFSLTPIVKRPGRMSYDFCLSCPIFISVEET